MELEEPALITLGEEGGRLSRPAAEQGPGRARAARKDDGRLLGALVRPLQGLRAGLRARREANPDARFLKINTDEEQELGSAFQIRSIPTLMIFRDKVLLFASREHEKG